MALPWLLTARFPWIKAPTSQEPTKRVHAIAHPVGRVLEMSVHDESEQGFTFGQNMQHSEQIAHHPQYPDPGTVPWWKKAEAALARSCRVAMRSRTRWAQNLMYNKTLSSEDVARIAAGCDWGKSPKKTRHRVRVQKNPTVSIIGRAGSQF